MFKVEDCPNCSHTGVDVRFHLPPVSWFLGIVALPLFLWKVVAGLGIVIAALFLGGWRRRCRSCGFVWDSTPELYKVLQVEDEVERKEQLRHLTSQTLQRQAARELLSKHLQLGEKVLIERAEMTSPHMRKKVSVLCDEHLALVDEVLKAYRLEFPDRELPSHPGFSCYADILEENNDVKEAIGLCEQALEDGWAGDWSERIERLRDENKESEGA